jgi:hypothetical protein
MSIEEAKQVLRNAGYYVDNLWSTEDVSNKLDDYIIPEGEELDETDMQNILDECVAGSWITEQINESIDDELGFRFKSKEDGE